MKISENFNQNVTLSELAALADSIGGQTGILEAAIYALEKGLADDFFYQRETIICNGLLDQAYSFLENPRTYLAAGVYGRIVLETTIREFAKLKQHENYDSKMKFNRLITELRVDGFIIQSFEEKLRYNYTIGSDAAHNHPDFANYNKKNLKEFLAFIKDDVLTLE
jgi:hypothetical protein